MRPLGYWIKEIDRRIEAGFGRLLADEALTRRHWQVLTTLAQGDMSRADLDAALAPFAATVGPETDDLIHRGWATASPRAGITAAGITATGTAAAGCPAGTAAAGTAAAGAVSLTADGRAAHDRVAERVRAFRAHVTDGLSEHDYATLVALLERVAGNLTPA